MESTRPPRTSVDTQESASPATGKRQPIAAEFSATPEWLTPRREFRLSCMLCGRFEDVAVVPTPRGRCATCGSSRLVERII